MIWGCKNGAQREKYMVWGYKNGARRAKSVIRGCKNGHQRAKSAIGVAKMEHGGKLETPKSQLPVGKTSGSGHQRTIREYSGSGEGEGVGDRD